MSGVNLIDFTLPLPAGAGIGSAGEKQPEKIVLPKRLPKRQEQEVSKVKQDWLKVLAALLGVILLAKLFGRLRK